MQLLWLLQNELSSLQQWAQELLPSNSMSPQKNKDRVEKKSGPKGDSTKPPCPLKSWYSHFDTLYHTMEPHSKKVRIPVSIHDSPAGPSLQVKEQQVDTNLNLLVRHMQLLCTPLGYLCVKCQRLTKQGHLKY